MNFSMETNMTFHDVNPYLIASSAQIVCQMKCILSYFQSNIFIPRNNHVCLISMSHEIIFFRPETSRDPTKEKTGLTFPQNIQIHVIGMFCIHRAKALFECGFVRFKKQHHIFLSSHKTNFTVVQRSLTCHYNIAVSLNIHRRKIQTQSVYIRQQSRRLRLQLSGTRRRVVW
jgi:hypothetical protein